MKHVDALSRHPIMMISVSPRIKQAQERDGKIQELKRQVLDKQTKDYIITADILYRIKDGQYLLVIPDDISTNLIREIHEENGHFTGEKLEHIIKQSYEIRNLGSKIKSCVESCITCLLADRKRGKKEGKLQPIPKEDRPLQTLHLDHLGPMTTTNKQYRYVFAVIDGFSKFCWLYATKSTGSNEVIKSLTTMNQIFGHPNRFITDKGAAYTSAEFFNYCEKNDIDHVTVTTGIPRGNGQVERLNQCIISILTKLSKGEPSSWYKHLPSVQVVLNSTYQRAIQTSPYEVMFGMQMKREKDLHILEILNEEMLQNFNDERENIRSKAKAQILKLQLENSSYHNKKTKSPHRYQIGDLVVIKRTQFGTGLKLKGHFLGPYRVTGSKGPNRYEVEKVAHGEGPIRTTTAADFMKIWLPYSSGSYEKQDGRVWASTQPMTSTTPATAATHTITCTAWDNREEKRRQSSSLEPAATSTERIPLLH